MDNILVTQLIQEALANVNVSIVVALMAIGFIIKHVKFLDKVNSDIIPPVLLLCSIVAMIVLEGFSVATIITAIVNAAIAIGLHQQGKNIFTVTVIPSISKLLSGLTGKKENATEPEVTEEVEVEDEPVDEVIEVAEEPVDEVVEEEETDI